MPDGTLEDAYQRGRRVRGEVLGEAHVERAIGNASDFSRPMQELVTEYCWGHVWARPGLPRRSAASSTSACSRRSTARTSCGVHARGAIRNGCTPEEIQETLLQAAIYCGVPAAMEAFRVVEAGDLRRSSASRRSRRQ